MTPGIYAMPAAHYHADPCPAPSMSAHDAQTLLSRSAAHAWHDHPRLNPQWQPDDPTPEQEEGLALHALLLEQENRVQPVNAPDWRKKEAQEARALARAAGVIPILAHRWDELRGTAEALRKTLAAHEVGDFLARPGAPEQTMLWQEDTDAGPIWCRSRVDWLCEDVPLLIDLKTVGGSASPDAWARSPQGKEAPLRAAHYLRGAEACGLARPRYFFALLERDAPHGVSICELSQALMTVGREQHEAARETWALCLRDGLWPSYPGFLATIEASTAAIYAHEDWKARREQMRQRAQRPFMHQAGGAVAEAIRNGGNPFA
jgi:hypothetical protein